MNILLSFLSGLTACGLLLSAPMSVAAEKDSVSQPAMVIIIDDIGNNYSQGHAAVSLPGPLTYAILPHSPHGPRLAREAAAEGKDVMLHAPMQNDHDQPLGPGALTVDLSRDEFLVVLRADLDSVPGALGLNNHMGSLLTRLQPQMEWVMEVARERGLFFIDSRTTAATVASRTAGQRGIPSLSRDVFLDHQRTEAFVHQQFQKAVNIASEQGTVVVIGHPYPVTVNYLQKALPLLDELGIRLLTASALLEQQSVQRRLAALARELAPQQP